MPRSLSLLRREHADPLAEPISAFESETQSVIQQTSPYSEHLILHVLAGMMVLTLALMSFVKLDRVVNSTGRVLPSMGSYFIQPLDRAIVTGILAHPGDLVRKGQVLATLDPTFAQADLRELEHKKASSEALVARLKAEQDGKPYVADPASPSSVLQAAIWAQRQAEYHQSINDFDARIRAAASAVQRSHQDALDYQKRLQVASQVENAHLELQRQGFGSKLSLLSATDNRVEMGRMAAESRNGAAQGQHDLAALVAQRGVYIGKWRDDIGTQLVSAQTDLNDATQGLAKASKVSDLSKLVAPADAVVLTVGKASLGSVFDPSAATTEPLFTLTPLGGPLEAEVRIAAKDVGFIRPGDPVRIKLDAYTFTRHGTAEGVVKSVSEGSFTTSDDGQVVDPYYKARVAITKVKLFHVPANFQLSPGLTMQGEVLVGKRTIMSYLLEGALRTGSEAMREPS
jgi:HlyD family type I secretion membrane fusion protein